jgi:very-short-patch-repair endonuclease
MFAPEAQTRVQPFLARCTVRGTTPATAAEMAAIVSMLEAIVTADRLAELWSNVKVRSEPGPLPVRLDQFISQADALAHVTRFGEARTTVDALLLRHGVRIALNTPQRWDAFVSSLAAARARIDAARQDAELVQLEEQTFGTATSAPAPEAIQLRQAMRARDPAAYALAVELVAAATAEQTAESRCRELLTTLRNAHSKLADLLIATHSDQRWDQPEELPESWAWAVAAAFCERNASPGRDQALAAQLAEVEQRLLHVTAQLAAAHGWLHCLSRMTQGQRQALQEFKFHIASIGKGTGQYAARGRAAARDAMTVAQAAVPAWVMPLSQVIETIPPNPDSFDVVIVDEASQVGLEGLFLLWLAPRMIVVGDDRQCVPGFGGVGEYQRIFDQRDAFLANMPKRTREMFKPKGSLYEILTTRFPQVIRLTEHFRCMPEIIGWSSDQFYRRTLTPLRQFGADRLEPLRVEFVDGAYPEGRESRIRNPVEAKRIIEALQAMLADDAYRNRSFGIVTLQGIGQAMLLDNMIAESIDQPTIEKHSIRVGTPADFQGDERDVMLLSMVTVNPAKMLTSRDDQRRFNVAASRARDQMWLFTSVGLDRLKTDDLRASLLSYMLTPPSPIPVSPADLSNVRPDELQVPFESLFEQRVFLRIRERGYAVVPQFPVAGKRIDLVVFGAQGRLAVECDGRYWHSAPEKQREDIRRERELVRANWRFWRIRESAFLLDPDEALEPLWRELATRGIEPGVHVPIARPREPNTEPWQPIQLSDLDEEEQEP